MQSPFTCITLFLLFVLRAAASPFVSTLDPSYQNQAVMGSAKDKPTIYFGYGSNLWLHQMDMRCPTSKYLGVARLNGYKWIINDRGYANVVEANTSDSEAVGSSSKYAHVVFGLVYSLKEEDERRLDKNEGVPIAYTKEDLLCDFWASRNASAVDVTKPPSESIDMLVYIDRNRTSEDQPKKEYIYRMNRGIDDAIKQGVPKEYVDDVMRKFIPAEEEDEIEGKWKRLSTEEKALRQAQRFEDESGVFKRDD
jgi:gamma-glutamylcyclotransferase